MNRLRYSPVTRRSPALFHWSYRDGFDERARPVTIDGVIGTHARASTKEAVDSNGRTYTIPYGGLGTDHVLIGAAYVPVGVVLEKADGDVAADSLTFPLLFPPQALTVYVKGVERGTNLLTSTVGLIGLGGSANASLFIGNSGADRYRVTHRVATDVTSTAAAATESGNTVELRATLSAAGVVKLGQSVNGAAEAVAAASSGLTLASAWASNLLHIGSRNGSPGKFAFQSVVIAAGYDRALDDLRTMSGV